VPTPAACIFLSGTTPDTEIIFPDMEKENLWCDFAQTVLGMNLLVMVKHCWYRHRGWKDWYHAEVME